MAQRKEEIKRILARIAREHERDGAGNMEVQHLVAWLRSSGAEDQQVIREVLLDDLRATLPGRIDRIALNALASDGASLVASALEAIVRSSEGRSEWRDAIIMGLAKMGHRPAIDLCA